jgi:hypothetical protein
VITPEYRERNTNGDVIPAKAEIQYAATTLGINRATTAEGGAWRRD